MCIDNALIIDGEGYLDKITVRNGKAIAEICCIDPKNEITEADESLWVQGHIMCDSVRKVIEEFNKTILAGVSVKIRFKARYIRVGYLHYCCSNAEPEQIVGLKTELLFVRAAT